MAFGKKGFLLFVNAPCMLTIDWQNIGKPVKAQRASLRTVLEILSHYSMLFDKIVNMKPWDDVCIHSMMLCSFCPMFVSVLQSSCEGSWSSCVRTGTGGVAMDIKFI